MKDLVIIKEYFVQFDVCIDNGYFVICVGLNFLLKYKFIYECLNIQRIGSEVGYFKCIICFNNKFNVEYYVICFKMKFKVGLY